MKRGKRSCRLWVERLSFLALGWLLGLWFRHGKETAGMHAAAPSSSTLPHYDYVVAVLAGLADEGALERTRRIYDRYDGHTIQTVGAAPLTFRLLFVIGDPRAPEDGALEGEFFRVPVAEGYEHISAKTLASMSLTQHLSFDYIFKTDTDTYPCMQRVSEILLAQPMHHKNRLYAGSLNLCGKVFPPGHKLHDPQFVQATEGSLDCHPVYHQGAFYILGRGLAEYLYRSRHDLQLMSNEDAMVGLWLLGAQRHLVDIGGAFYCECFTRPVPAVPLAFYHFCKTEEKVQTCLRKFPLC
jgi:hypothetical protein